MLAKRVVKTFNGRVHFNVEDYGDSDLGDQLGVAEYPAIFIDDVLVATPRDFWEWDGGRGRYTPWRKLESRQAFEKDLTGMLELRLSGGQLARAVSGSDGPGEIARRLPELTLTDLDGETLATAELEGRAVVVAFWAPWCPPCVNSLDWLLTASERHGDKLSVIVLAVQTDEAAVRKVLGPYRDRLSRSSASPRWVLASTDDADAFGGAMAVPTFRIFDRQGRLTSELYGAPPDLHERIDQRVAALLSTVPSL